MVSGNAHNIRIEHDENDPILVELAILDEDRPLATPALIADVAGKPSAAMSLVDGRVVADPFTHTGLARVALAQRAKAHHAAIRTPNLVERLLLELRRGRRAPAMG